MREINSDIETREEAVAIVDGLMDFLLDEDFIRKSKEVFLINFKELGKDLQKLKGYLESLEVENDN